MQDIPVFAAIFVSLLVFYLSAHRRTMNSYKTAVPFLQ
ncbi:hypothetical protein TBLA_0D04150 [Henningerozyma blattae CBS 6284]|uniref:Uncharacterized protein n=1 Tax=Henningerozyma blattae (strain ATCC 34711 / CBS 6284 / DSM 70876 / NBRC 10599 / NRRL Y-10934 / UCD 77-7) TaxID=1071380 RepID=I2H3G0_HENB6|nr:hypothetical protein TBLA_0D04150 [Tetrapisispora blattae CBS 6284]CCH60912.1 hypothetical protein TBLA_0D04150 [Tetrapisispora blattae CBS 6284]